MKITIYELLRKIKDLENLPKKLKYENHIYEYLEGSYDWSYHNGYDGTISFLLTDIFNKCFNTIDILNINVEILEEEKKIPEKLDIVKEKNCKNNWKWQVKGEIYYYNMSTPQKIIADKLNEIIDCLEYLKSKGGE